MRKYIKAGVLIFVLVAPVLVFLFLKVFGQNHYTVRTFHPLKIEARMVGGQMKNDTIYHKIPPFTLSSQSGQAVTERTLANSIYVANFFSIKCTGICPKMLAQLARVQNAFEFNKDVKIISHVIGILNEQRDSLASYAKKYEAMEGKWYFLAGDSSQIEKLAQQGYKMSEFALKNDDSDTFAAEKFVLIDKNRQIRGYYDGTDPEEVDRLVLEIKILQYEDKLDK